jgi:hypothetical protein
MKEKVNNTRSKEEQVQDIERKIENIKDQIEVLEARKVILSQQLKRLTTNK